MAKHNFPFNLRDICYLEGIPVPNRTHCQINCINCGKKKLDLDFGEDVFKCWTCGIQGGLLQFYAYCEGDGNMSPSDARREIMEKLFGTQPEKKEEKNKWYEKMKERRKQIAEEEIPQSDTRPVEDLNATYDALLNILTLSKDHEDDLVKRGLSREYISKRKYRTYPLSAYDEIPRKLLEDGKYLDGIPGMYKAGGRWMLREMKRGIMIPIINRNDMIVGFQIRKDNNLLKTTYKTDSMGNYLLDSNGNKIVDKVESKFTWLSSKGKLCGTGTPAFVHHACEFERKDGEKVPKLSINKGILLTEGPLKADIFHEITDYPAISVPGVSCQTQLKDALIYLKQLGFETVYNGFDMDYVKNQNVYNALEENYKLILQIGLHLVRVHWNPEMKGIDDYYAKK